MSRKLLFFLLAVAVLVLVPPSIVPTPALLAQEMHNSSPAVPSTQLTIRAADGKTLRLSAQDLAALPHKSITVFNGHSKTNETYSGVPLATLLAKVGVPQGEQVRGAVLLTGVVAEGTDGYKVLYSLAELDPAIHTGDVIVADSINGQKLSADGAFKLVSSEDKRPARWVRNLSTISVVQVKP